MPFCVQENADDRHEVLGQPVVVTVLAGGSPCQLVEKPFC